MGQFFKARVVMFSTILVGALLSTKLCLHTDLVDFRCRAITTPRRTLARLFPITHTVNWTWLLTASLSLFSAIRGLTAFTTTHLLLGDRKGLGLCASSTANGLCFPIATFNFPSSSLGTNTLAKFTPGTFAIFRAARQITRSGADVAMLVVAITLGVGGIDCNIENSVLLASWATFCTTRTIAAIGTFTPIFPVALTILLAWFRAARMDLFKTTWLRALFATVT